MPRAERPPMGAMYRDEMARRVEVEAERMQLRATMRMSSHATQCFDGVEFRTSAGRTPVNTPNATSGPVTAQSVTFRADGTSEWPGMHGLSFARDSSLSGGDTTLADSSKALRCSLRNVLMESDAYAVDLRWDGGCGQLILSEDAYVRHQNDVLTLGQIGQHRRTVSIYRSTGGRYARVVAGCYRGTIEELAKRIATKRGPIDWMHMSAEAKVAQRQAYEIVVESGLALQRRWREEART